MAKLATRTTRARARPLTVGWSCSAMAASTTSSVPNTMPPKSTAPAASPPRSAKGTAAPVITAVCTHAGKWRPS